MDLYHAFPVSPGLYHDDPILDWMGKIFHFYGSQLDKFEIGIRTGNDIEDLHGFRVRIRYFKVISRVFKEFFINGANEQFRHLLKKAGKATGPVRDLDVFTEKYMQGEEIRNNGIIANIVCMETYLSGEYGKRKSQLFQFLDSQEFLEMKRIIDSVKHSEILESGCVRIPNRYGLIKDTISVRLKKVYKEYHSLDLYAYSQLHDIRIRIKRLRYSIEIFKEVLVDEGQQLLWILRDLQDALGNYCDNAIAERIVEDYLENSEQDDCEEAKFQEFLTKEERPKLMGDVFNAFQEFNNFDFYRELDEAIAPLRI